MAHKGNQSENKDFSANLAEEAAKTGRLPKKARKPFFTALAIVVVAASLGNILLKYGLQGDRAPSVQSLSGIPQAAISTLTNVWVVLAILLLILEFICQIYAMRFGPLSLMVPLRGASTYIVSSLLAQYFLNEQVTPERWAALVIILVGVTMIGLSGGES